MNSKYSMYELSEGARLLLGIGRDFSDFLCEYGGTHLEDGELDLMKTIWNLERERREAEKYKPIDLPAGMIARRINEFVKDEPDNKNIRNEIDRILKNHGLAVLWGEGA